MYAHFQKRRMNVEISDLEQIDSFAIVPNKYISLPGSITVSFLRPNCIDRMYCYKLYRFIVNKYKEKCRNWMYRHKD